MRVGKRRARRWGPTPGRTDLGARKRTGCPCRARRKPGCQTTRSRGPRTHACSAQLVALHHRGPSAQLRRPAGAGQPARAAPDHQVVVRGHDAGGRRRALRLRLLPASHGAGAGAGGPRLRQREAGEGARHPPPAPPGVPAQGPAQQGHARGSARGGGGPGVGGRGRERGRSGRRRAASATSP